LHGNGFAARADNFRDNFVRARFAGRIIDDDRRTFRRQMFGDGSADAFGCARDDRDFACEFIVCAHNFILSVFKFVVC
jgi:hypothetical protein